MARKATQSRNKTKRRTSGPSVQKTVAVKRPLLTPTTVLVVLLFIAVTGAIFYQNRQKKAQALLATPTGGPATIFPAGEGNPTDIKVQPADGSGPVQIVRNEKGAWELQLPEKAEADQGSAEAAASQLMSLDTSLKDIPGSVEIFGLDKPSYTITIKFSGGQTHILEIGSNTPTNNGYYVRLDAGRPMVVGTSGIDALTNLVASPPYLSTPTPSPLPPTNTPVSPSGTNPAPGTEITVTPTP